MSCACRSPYEIELFLPRSEEDPSFIGQIGVVFHHDENLLPVPFGDRCEGVELDGDVRSLAQALGDGVLITTAGGAEVDVGAKAVPLIADRMRIDLRLEALRLHRRHCIAVDLADR